MLFKISQAANINVSLDGKEFLMVKRKFGFRVVSRFFRDGKLVFESSLLSIAWVNLVRIRYQDLPHVVVFEKTSGRLYSLFYNDVELSMAIKYFKRPAFRLYKDGIEVATIGNPKFITVDGRYYEMRTEEPDETVHLYLLILFLSQLPAFDGRGKLTSFSRFFLN